jgi:aspartate kinase
LKKTFSRELRRVNIIVQKFGGSSVATIDKIKTVAQRVARGVREGNKVVVVLSAMGKTTDGLIGLAEQITPNPSPREMDMLMATGEQVAIALFSIALHQLGVSAVSLTGPQVGIRAEPSFRKGKILAIRTDRLTRELAKNEVVAVAGFQGVTEDDDIVTLGRGGSDLTAVALAAVVKASACEIFTDVDGIFTADPRLVPRAHFLEVISFEEMLELASSGAGVMQARSIEFGKNHGVEIRVRCTFNDNPGTLIKEEDPRMEKVVIRGLAHDLKEAKITVREIPNLPGMAARLFGALAQNKVNVDMIVQSNSLRGTTDISFTVNREDLNQALEVARQVAQEIKAGQVESYNDIAKISVVGIGMRSHPGVASTMFSTLGREGINIDLISTSEIRISCTIEAKDCPRALQVLHTAFALDAPEARHLGSKESTYT